jgi:hypothetical protein
MDNTLKGAATKLCEALDEMRRSGGKVSPRVALAEAELKKALKAPDPVRAWLKRVDEDYESESDVMADACQLSELRNILYGER